MAARTIGSDSKHIRRWAIGRVVAGEIVVEDRRSTRINQDDLCEEIAELAPICARDSKDHAERLAPVIPHIRSLVRYWGDQHLQFDRWPSAGDG